MPAGVAVLERMGFAETVILDPLTGGGMAQALMTAELLVSCLLRSARNNDRWIWAFECGRRALLTDYCLLTQAVLSLASHPKVRAKVLSLLRLSPSLLSHLIGVAGGVRHLFSGSQLNAALRAGFEP